MGRPLKKSFFKTGAGNQLKIRAKVGSNAEGDGFIVSQKSAKRYKVNVGGNIGVCKLVDKANGSLLANEMSIAVLTDANTVARVTKLTSHLATVNGARVGWNFDAALDDSRVQAADADGSAPAAVAITITVDPANASVAAPDPHTFNVTATITAGHTLKYRWQVSADAGTTWTNLTSTGVYTGATAASLVISDSTGLDANQYRCACSATGVTAVNSAAATLTVT